MEAITADEEVGESLEQFCEKDKMYWLLRQDFFLKKNHLFIIQQILMEQLVFGRWFVKCCKRALEDGYDWDVVARMAKTEISEERFAILEQI